MRTFLILIRVQLLALLHSLTPRTRSGRSGGCLIIGSYVLLCLLGVFYLALTGISLMSLGLANAIPAFAVVMGAVGGVVFTFLKANGTLFGLTDFDLVMSLPISRRTVVASRVAALYASAVFLGLVLGGPLWAVYLLLVSSTPMAVMSCLISLVLAPAIPTAIAIFAAFGVAALASRFRHANLAYIIISLVAFAALFIGVYGFSFSSNMSGHEATMQQLESGLALASDLVGIAWPPARWIALACTKGSLVALVAFVATSIAVPALALEIMQRFYLNINAALSASVHRRALSGSELRRRSGEHTAPFAALMRKEFQTLLGIPSYAFNCLFGYLLMIIIAVALSVVGLEDFLASGALNGIEMDAATYREAASGIANALPWVFVFCAITSPSAACSVSMEGKAAWICASVPLPMRTILGAKLAANAVPMGITLLASALILLVTGQVDFLHAISILVTAFGMFYAMVNVGLGIDAREPNFSWTSPNEVVKRSKPINVTVIGGMVLSFIGLFGAPALSLTVTPAAGLILNLAAGIIGIAAGHLRFTHTCKDARLYTN